MDTQWITLVGTVGFPAVVAWYCLTTLNKTVQANTATMTEMRQVLAKICEHLNLPEK